MTEFENAYRNHLEPCERYIFTKESPEHNIVSSSKGIPDCSQVVYDFYYFMLGSGFAHKSVLEAFQRILEEMQ